MPGPLLTFEGVAEPQSGAVVRRLTAMAIVGPNHYVEAINSSG